MARDYKAEYAKYQGTPEQKKRRAMRNKARRYAIKTGQARKGDGRDVHHRNGNPMDFNPNNLQVKPASDNRSFARTKKATKKYRTG
tara:strand:- start:597 stop:854 length:258 start_codon:yes stop_codon:yes gene_type:complete